MEPPDAEPLVKLPLLTAGETESLWYVVERALRHKMPAGRWLLLTGLNVDIAAPRLEPAPVELLQIRPLTIAEADALYELLDGECELVAWGNPGDDWGRLNSLRTAVGEALSSATRVRRDA